jgi:hypothetical protein
MYYPYIDMYVSHGGFGNWGSHFWADQGQVTNVIETADTYKCMYGPATSNLTLSSLKIPGLF